MGKRQRKRERDSESHFKRYPNERLLSTSSANKASGSWWRLLGLIFVVVVIGFYFAGVLEPVSLSPEQVKLLEENTPKSLHGMGLSR